VVGYNVQVAVDEKHKLMVEPEVTNAVTDQDQPVPMAERAQQPLGVEKLEGVADMGYYDGAEVQKCEEGRTVYIPKPHTSANTKLGWFGKVRFERPQDPLLFDGSLWALCLESSMHAQSGQPTHYALGV
jgi:hypothetical protein